MDPSRAAEKPPPDRAGPQSPHQADDPRPGRSGPRPAGGVPQRPDRSQHLRPRPATNARRTTAAPAWTPPRSRCSPAARPSAPGCAPATPTAAGTSAKATTASARTTRASRCARSPGRWKPPSPPRPGRPARRPRTRICAIGLALARPGEDPGGTGARVLASVAARGHKTGWLGYDRAYTAGAARAIPPARPRPGLPAGHGLPRSTSSASRPTPAAPSWSRATWYCPALPGPLITATTRPARPRHHPRPLRPADHRPLPLPAQAQRRPRRRRLPAAVLPGRRPPSRADLPAAPGLAVTPRRARQGPPATARTAQDLHPDRDHHRP